MTGTPHTHEASGRYTDVHGDGRHLRFTPEPAPAPTAAALPHDPDWVYSEASGTLYGPSDSPHLRVIVATEVDPKFGRLIADTMNGPALAEVRPAAAPDPREPKPCPRCGTVCAHDGWGHVHPDGVGIGSCAAPGPRFRDQLAATLRRFGVEPDNHMRYEGPGSTSITVADALAAELRAALVGDLPGAYPWHEIVDRWLAPGGAIAAHMEARVQAAANQREAEAERGLEAQYRAAWDAWVAVTKPGDEVSPSPEARAAWARVNQTLDDKDAVAAALASPAPAPSAEEESLAEGVNQKR